MSFNITEPLASVFTLIEGLLCGAKETSFNQHSVEDEAKMIYLDALFFLNSICSHKQKSRGMITMSHVVCCQ